MGEARFLPLLAGDFSRPFAWRNGRIVSLAEFAVDAAAIASRLPAGRAMINLCEDRYAFIAAYIAALSLRHTVLLPSSRTEQIIVEVAAANPESYRVDDAFVSASLRARSMGSGIKNEVAADHLAMVGYTSGSTGQPTRHEKHWSSVFASTAQNARAIRGALKVPEERTVWLVATVPPQHMYGMEMSVLLPLLSSIAIHSSRPLFPADIAAALEKVEAPRMLVSTPVHLRAIVESPQPFPEVSLIVSATAPLDGLLAAAVERKLGGRLLEFFGSTETCIFASRFTASQALWQLYEGVSLKAHSDSTQVDAPWFASPMTLQDIVELRGKHEFAVLGRNTDMIEVAGKRASLAELTRRVREIEGVEDAAVFQPEPDAPGSVRRVAALVVAPTRTARQISDRLAASIDPAFLPRPLVIVPSLPRNDVGKLPSDKLIAALRTAKP